MKTASAQLTFSEHLQELRRRLTYSVLALLAGAVLGYVLKNSVIARLVHPLDLPLYYNNPGGSLAFIVQISLAVGVVIALPVLTYNLLRFIEPALSNERLSRRRILVVLTSSWLLAAAGILFGYYIILPMSFHFFAGFNIGPVKPLISTSEYFSFVLSCLVSFAAIFQLPLLLLFVNSIHRFPPGSMRRYRRHVLVGAFILAVILPFTYDPITQFVMAVPIVFLFELSLLLLWAKNRRYHHWIQIDDYRPSTRAVAKISAPPAPAPMPVSAPVLQRFRPQPQPTQQRILSHNVLDLRSQS